ncbi:MAG: amidohydrolase family protein [Chitinispirillales bacterium]|jgi:predicted TIM-barrel fold metal-dependent hydrolase|nr:amidohydrolase family protein [Chitinispirillales bacterium]
MTTIIDFHTHFFPPELAERALTRLIENAAPTIAMKNHTDGTVGGLIESMRASGVGKSVALPVATKPSQVSTINRGCADTGSACPEIIQFGAMHPEMEGFEAEIDFLSVNGIKGIKLHPEYQYSYVDDPKAFPMYEKLASAGLIVVFHSGKDPGPFTNDHAMPPALRKVHENFPALKMVAAHLGGWMVWKEVEETLAGLDIFFDTSAIYGLLSPEDFVRICRKHGPEKILFGSDSPWYGQGESVEWIKRSGLSDAEIEAVFHVNAEKLLGY